ncbi:MAG: biotin-dependent carboxyltransferase family protein [Kiloniellaceae bacterium]
MSAALRVRSGGSHSTIQDLGRFGYQDLGIPVSGALDGISLRLANRLVGNAENEGALEILFQGPTLEVAADSVRVALAGSDTPIEVLGDAPRRVPPWQSVRLRRGAAFRIGALADSACCYLAVEGGFALEPCLGSLSTYVRGGFGGLAGRALRAGDALGLSLAAAPERAERYLPAPPGLLVRDRVRVVLGPQDGNFTQESIATLLKATFSVSKDSDRMGMRLDGPKLEHGPGFNIVSDGVVTGAVQVPGSGQPIVLLADHQTTGGYPKIATVISADLPLVGRLKPGDEIRFAALDVAQAEALRREQERTLSALAARPEPEREVGSIDLRSLYDGNLVSGVVSGTE